MNKNLLMITAAAGFIVSQAGLGQIEPGTIDRIPTEPGLQRETPPPVATPPYNPRPETRTVTGKSLARVSELMGANVTSEDGQKLGAIKDLVVDSQGQKVKFVVLGRGGILGFREQLVRCNIDF